MKKLNDAQVKQAVKAIQAALVDVDKAKMLHDGGVMTCNCPCCARLRRMLDRYLGREIKDVPYHEAFVGWAVKDDAGDLYLNADDMPMHRKGAEELRRELLSKEKRAEAVKDFWLVRVRHEVKELPKSARKR